MNMADGGMRVTKPTSGAPYLIQDIRVSVPHQVAVFITADQVINSKDLHRALATKELFLLSGIIYQTEDAVELAPPVPSTAPTTASSTSKAEEGLREGMAKLEKQISALTAALEKMAANPVTHVTNIVNGGPVPKESASIDLAAPMFIPDDLVPTKADVNIQVRENVTDGGVSEAASKLKALRQKPKS